MHHSNRLLVFGFPDVRCHRFRRLSREFLAGVAVLLPSCLGLTALRVEGLEKSLVSSEPADRGCVIQAASVWAEEADSANSARRLMAMVLDRLEDTNRFVALQAKLAVRFLLSADGRWRTQEIAVQEVARALRNSDSSHRVAQALGRLGGTSVERLLFVEAYPELGEPVRLAARHAWNGRREARAGDPQPALPSGTHSTLASTVLLSSYGPPFPQDAPRPFLESALQDRDPIQRALAAELLGSGSVGLQGPDDQTNVVSRLMPLLDDPHPVVRRSATVALGVLAELDGRGRSAAWRRVMELAFDPYPQVSLGALNGMAYQRAFLGRGGRPLQQQYEKALHHEDPGLRGRALGAFLSAWDPQALVCAPMRSTVHRLSLEEWGASQLRRLCADSQPWIRARAASIYAKTLSELRHAPSADQVRLLATDADPEVRAAAIHLLAACGKAWIETNRTAALDLLTAALVDARVGVRLEALKSTHRFRDVLGEKDPAVPGILAALSQSVNSDHPSLVRRACQAVAVLSPRLAGSELTERVTNALIRDVLSQEAGFAPSPTMDSLAELITAQPLPRVAVTMVRRLMADLPLATPEGRTNVCYILCGVMNQTAHAALQEVCGDALLDFMADDTEPALRALAARIVAWRPAEIRRKAPAAVHSPLRRRLTTRLVELLDNESDDVRASAVAGLLSQHNGSLEPPLQRALDTLQKAARATPCWTVGLDLLSGLVRSDDEQVRAVATRVARALSAHPEEQIRRWAGVALGWAEPRFR